MSGRRDFGRGDEGFGEGRGRSHNRPSDLGQSEQHATQQGAQQPEGIEEGPRGAEVTTTTTVENAGQGSGGSSPVPEGVEGDSSTQTGGGSGTSGSSGQQGGETGGGQ